MKILSGFENHLGFVKIFICRCIAATIAVEILFAGSAAKRLERKACVPPNGVALIFFQKMPLRLLY